MGSMAIKMANCSHKNFKTVNVKDDQSNPNKYFCVCIVTRESQYYARQASFSMTVFVAMMHGPQYSMLVVGTTIIVGKSGASKCQFQHKGRF